jgi:serine/threonine-protein kinase
MELRAFGRYRLLGRLRGSPSTSELFLAQHEQEDGDGRYVVKLMMPGDEESRAQREAMFEHEARLLGALNHPCIPTIHEYGRKEGMPYMVMEHVDGVDLAALLHHHEDEPIALSKELVVYVMGQIVDALHRVHTIAEEESDGSPNSLDVLHRDLCPANVYLSRDGDVMLGDFGSATSRWLPAEFDAKSAGHTAYKAPERITGSGEATVKSELFSLAVMMWEMLRGERCFRAENELKTMDAIVRFDISQSGRRVSGLSSRLSEIVRRNLDRDPGRRYTGAFQVLQRLAQSPEAQAAETSRLELARLVQAEAAARDS